MAHSRSTTSSFSLCKSIAIEISALLCYRTAYLWTQLMHGFASYISVDCYCKKVHLSVVMMCGFDDIISVCCVQ